ncbi:MULTISPECIES: sulfite exporter TauE/SafE family protein [unclassified Streptomyces]|uniref:sulfite exporter TauE/SafE family protein n=1 Tax=unclassified Streptomyces TaxID=2593676 RepID=UPI0004C0C384|nr:MULTISPECIES: sulfite exporter TauE/SafE family protein [unclassified Streptomyces]
MDTMTLWHLTGWEFAALAFAALLVGFSKTAVSGANTVSLAIFAAVLPARASTGILLPVLIAGDLLAVATYRRHAHWPTLWRLFPAVGAGVVLGTLFLMWADDAIVRTSIGAILLLMAAVTVWRRRGTEPAARPAVEPATEAPAGSGAGPDSPISPSNVDPVGPSRPVNPTGPTGPTGPGPTGSGDGTDSTRPADPATSRSARLTARSYGVLGGFTTMVANAGGPVMSLYLLSAGFRKLGFLGTSAFFFLIVNVSKLPFSAGLGLIDGRSLLLDAALVVFVVPGAFLGKWAVSRINQRLFEQLVIGATVLGGLQLLLR